MIGRVLFLSLAFAAPAIQAATPFTCQSEAESSRHRATIEGLKEPANQGGSLLSYELDLGVKCDRSGSCQYEQIEKVFKLANRQDYAPIRYKGFEQFLLPMALGKPSQDSGQIQLLVPEVLNANSPFDGKLIFSRINGSFGFTLDLNCRVSGQEIMRDRRADDVDSAIAKAQRILEDEFGLGAVNLQINRSELATQLAENNQVTFLDALHRALVSFMDDDDDNESPVAIARNGAENDWDISHPAFTLNEYLVSRWYLRHVLSTKGASLDFSRGPYPPENGESTENNWVFRLYVDDLSDHIYWSIQAKDGRQNTYNYGFN
ncbi:hypothetical protein [Pseudobacteriovorax antillogorgiicola]|uniref:Uncharacterized protein n=1 Tax=Pseudobacteriovorax antillogorgiicola TaxID=1513793 RepID=A0A1Y6BRH3_9BACT|nr:hypothetical protein [Pseudobacteriovorax antillogorgiicola]TCS53189.1 hypothetical protein EDD56_108240 [Pseudobacteriovorax antillogorgiicola]SMF24458.1 hypothetical protein SAMN06296036_1086 [Pseudobacteriovorax antillogorgiicola]